MSRVVCSLDIIDYGAGPPAEVRHSDSFALEADGQVQYGQVEGQVGSVQTIVFDRLGATYERFFALLVEEGGVEILWPDVIGDFEFAGGEPVDATDLSSWHEPPIPGDAPLQPVTGLYVTTSKLRPTQALRVSSPDDGQRATYIHIEGKTLVGPGEWNG